jgi:hypothetical protein
MRDATMEMPPLRVSFFSCGVSPLRLSYVVVATRQERRVVAPR